MTERITPMQSCSRLRAPKRLARGLQCANAIKTCRDEALMDVTAGEEDAVSLRALALALLALAFGHMLSTLLRTIPAVSLDLMARDFHLEPQALASLTSIYPFAFAIAQIPVGAAMDRFGVRPVSLSLLAGTAVGSVVAGFASGPASFAFGQLLLGIFNSGMLMCPMTLAAKNLSAGRLWGLARAILVVGNIGMLVSAR